MAVDNRPPIPTALAREIARQGEVRLNAVLALTTLAVNRAIMLCGIFGAASVALCAAVLTYLGTEHYALRLVWSGAATAGLLFLAAVAAAYAAAPRTFALAGGEPDLLRAAAWDGFGWREESYVLDATATRFALALARPIAPRYGIVGGVPPGRRANLERDRNRLGGDHRVRIEEARESDEVPFQRALVFRSPCGQWLEANDVRPPAQRDTSQPFLTASVASLNIIAQKCGRLHDS